MNYLSNCDRFGAVLGDSAAFFRKIAFEIEADPQLIEKYNSHSAINNLIINENQSCFTRVQAYEALAYGDAGVLLACPGSSLAGLVMDEIGNEEQRNYFHQYVKNEKACTFLAVTEPEYGSHLASLTTRLKISYSNKNSILNGEKWLVGHGGTGKIGVAIIKTNDGPLGIRALLLTQEQLIQPSIQRYTLPMSGLRGARLGRLIFKDHSIEMDYLLGSHLNAAEHGMMALIKTFNRMRPCVGALAVGTAQALIDYLYMSEIVLSKTQSRMLNQLNQKNSSSRELLYHAARHVEQNPYESGFSSLAKVKSTRTAEEIAACVLQLIGGGAFADHPYIEKWYRDIWGFEYMEGTQNIHKINTFNSYHRGGLRLNLEC